MRAVRLSAVSEVIASSVVALVGNEVAESGVLEAVADGGVDIWGDGGIAVRGGVGDIAVHEFGIVSGSVVGSGIINLRDIGADSRDFSLRTSDGGAIETWASAVHRLINASAGGSVARAVVTSELA